MKSVKSPMAIERRLTRIRFGHFESSPAVFHWLEAWVFWFDEWRAFDAHEVMWNAGVMCRAEFEATYGPLPELPETAFAGTARERLRFRPRSIARQRFRPGRWREHAFAT
jgi:hypothetical protein